MKLPPLNLLVGGALAGAVFVVAAMGLVWTPYDPLKLDFLARFAPPSAHHLLGTDEFGRDVLSRLMRAATTSVWISILTVCASVLAGTALGLVTGYVRGWTDRILMMFNDALLAFPGILLALGLLSTPFLGRNVRAEESVVRISKQYGLGYMSMMVMEHEHLVEKHAAK